MNRNFIIIPNEFIGFYIYLQKNINSQLNSLIKKEKIDDSFPILNFNFYPLYKKINEYSELLTKDDYLGGYEDTLKTKYLYSLVDFKDFSLPDGFTDNENNVFNAIVKKIKEPDLKILKSKRPVFALSKISFLSSLSASMNNFGGYINEENSNISNMKPSTLLSTIHISDIAHLKKYLLSNQEKENVQKYAKIVSKIKISEADYNTAIDVLNWYTDDNLELNTEKEFSILRILNSKASYLTLEQCKNIVDSIYLMKVNKEKSTKDVEVVEVKEQEYIGDEKEKIASVWLKLVGGNIYKNTHSDTYAYYFETIDGRSVIWNASNRGGFDFLFDKYSDIKKLFRTAKNQNIWLEIKGSVKEHKTYSGVEQTVLTRVKSVRSNFTKQFTTDTMFHFDEKYKLNQFLISNIEENELKNSEDTFFKYTVTDIDGITGYFLIPSKIDDVDIGDYISMPCQENHGEIVGIRMKNIVKIENFEDAFEHTLLTKLQAKKFGVKK